MKKIIILSIIGLSVLESTVIFASDYSFPCPSVDKLAITANYSVIYAPLTSGMPQNLEGSVYGTNNAAWIAPMGGGNIIGSIDYKHSYFLSSNVQGLVYCKYIIKGAHYKTGRPLKIEAWLQPGNEDYPYLYNYSLSAGKTRSANINTLIIASDQ